MVTTPPSAPRASLAFIDAQGMMMEQTFPRYMRDGDIVCGLLDDDYRPMKMGEYVETNRRFDTLPEFARAVFADYTRNPGDTARRRLFESLEKDALSAYQDAMKTAGLSHTRGHITAIADRLHYGGRGAAEPVWNVSGQPLRHSKASPAQIAYMKKQQNLLPAGAIESAYARNDYRDLARSAGMSTEVAKMALESEIATRFRAQRQTPHL